MPGSSDLDGLRIVLDPIGQIGVAAALMLVMFGVALGLRLADFRFLLNAPRIFFAGVALQVIALPAVTFALVHILAPPPSIALGMIVVACCPGGAVSNLLTFLARGDVAVSVALTATSSLLAAPLLAGMLVATRAPEIAARMRKKITLFGTAVLGGTIVYGIIYFFPVLWPEIRLLAGVAIVHNATAFATGAIAAWFLSRDAAVRRALTFEVGIQNSGLALIILLAQLHGVGGAAAIAAIWGVWHLLAGGLLVMAYRFYDRRMIDKVEGNSADN